MRPNIIAGLLTAGLLTLSALSINAAEEAMDSAALAKALSEASVPLDRGLTASASEGTPISGKYELEDGALQLSVYTAKGDQFSEVIVDHKSGMIKAAEKITEADDLDDAKAQSQAMAKAKRSLDQAVVSAVAANPGYRAVSATPELKDGKPIAAITLMKGAEVKKITEKLD